MNLPCRLDLVSRCGAGCTLCEMCCPCFSLWKFLQRKEQFLNVACKLLVKVLGFFCILGMDQNWKIYGTETLRNWIEGTLPLSYDLFLIWWFGEKKDSKFPSFSQSCKEINISLRWKYETCLSVLWLFHRAGVLWMRWLLKVPKCLFYSFCDRCDAVELWDGSAQIGILCSALKQAVTHAGKDN